MNMDGQMGVAAQVILAAFVISAVFIVLTATLYFHARKQAFSPADHCDASVVDKGLVVLVCGCKIWSAWLFFYQRILEMICSAIAYATSVYTDSKMVETRTPASLTTCGCVLPTPCVCCQGKYGQ